MANIFLIKGLFNKWLCLLFRVREGKDIGDTMTVTDDQLACTQITPGITANNSFNVCVITVAKGAKQFLVASVFRALWATSADTKALHKTLNTIVIKYKKFFNLDDFNLP